MIPIEVRALMQLLDEPSSTVKAALTRADVVSVLVHHAQHREVAMGLSRIAQSHRPSRMALTGYVEIVCQAMLQSDKPTMHSLMEILNVIEAHVWSSIGTEVFDLILNAVLHAMNFRVRGVAAFLRKLPRDARVTQTLHIALMARRSVTTFSPTMVDAYMELAMRCPGDMATIFGKHVVTATVRGGRDALVTYGPLMLIMSPCLSMDAYDAALIDLLCAEDERIYKPPVVHTLMHMLRRDASGIVARDMLLHDRVDACLSRMIEHQDDILRDDSALILLQLLSIRLSTNEINDEQVRLMRSHLAAFPEHFLFEAPTTLAAADHILQLGNFLHVPSEVLQKYARVAEELRQQQERQAKLLEVGIADLDLPDAFQCPVTREEMRDPVVASDGHTYERSTLITLLQGDKKSPLTRETLRADVMIPNINLRKRIRDYSDDVCKAVKTARSTQGCGVDAIIDMLRDEADA